MEKSESYYFFKLLNFYMKRNRYEHHNLFLRNCEEQRVVANGLKFKKHANIESVTEEFDRRWNSILSEASYRIQELLVKETHEVRDRITEEIFNVEEIITAKYGRPKAEQTIKK